MPMASMVAPAQDLESGVLQNPQEFSFQGFQGRRILRMSGLMRGAHCCKGEKRPRLRAWHAGPISNYRNTKPKDTWSAVYCGSSGKLRFGI